MLVSRLLEINFVNSLNFHHSGNPFLKWAVSFTFVETARYPLQKWYIWATFQFFSSHQLLIFNRACYSIYLHEKYSIWVSFEFPDNNTLTGPANCKKTSRHHAHLSLCEKSRKTDDAKSRKWAKTSIWAIFGQFRCQISPNCKFFWKINFKLKLKVIFSTNFSSKLLEPSLRKISKCLILG